MDWLSNRESYSENELENFQFYPHLPFDIRTVKLHIDSAVQIWKDSNEPMIILAMHKRLDGDSMGATALPYGKKTLGRTCECMFQHKSLCLTLHKTSNAIFNCRSVTWVKHESMGPSTVCHCKSDTKSPAGEDDIIISITSFSRKPLTFVVMYGCTEKVMNDVAACLKKYRRSAFHPFMLRMIFVELERERLMNALRLKTPCLQDRIIGMERRLNNERLPTEHGAVQKKVEPHQTIIRNDCDALEIWSDVSQLKNGLEAFIPVLDTILGAVTNEYKKRPEIDLELGSIVSYQQGNWAECTEKIESRLTEIILELQCKIRACDSLLSCMALATQMEWNFHTRRDTRANIYIAYSSMRDSTQMKYISKLGMIFLPGTLLATIFSMGVFKWIPDNSEQIISPYVSLYFGLTVSLTAYALRSWGKKLKDQEEKASREVLEAVESDSDSLKVITKESVQ
ncbi:hypothetical protein BX600DRAFT_518035 [Xylariales sp. PMI_506]|nr:hypothetical protein BX600DRAFT_518035 [Xylariales sp. PMI_506]